MPAFDPVRDAVLNSPVTPSNTLPFQPPSSTSSPSLGRRATDLSVLLNSESQEPTITLRTPPLPRPSSGLARLLNADLANVSDDDDDDNKLSFAEPLSRASNLTVATTSLRRNLPSSASFSRRASDSSVLPSPTSSSTGAGSAHNLFGDSPVRESPAIPSNTSLLTRTPPSLPTNLAPSSWIHNSSPSTMPPPPQPRPSNVPYHPGTRITPPGSVLMPLTQAELEMFREYRGVGTLRLTKRKRGRSTEVDTREQPPVKRLVGDVGVVVEHYNARPEVGVIQRQESPIIGLKNFNNWVKSVLITRFAHPALATGAGSVSSNGHARGKSRPPSGKVLDMGCGKGGDITKWAKARVKELIGVDIAAVSVDQARSRWETLRAPRFAATFAPLDCYTQSLTRVIPPARLVEPFDVVSMQFCMHYAFESAQKARCMLENVSRWLRPGGVFIGTIPNAEWLLSQLDTVPLDQEDLSFGNSVYKITFESRQQRPLFGDKYWFFLQDAVENVPEYIVRWSNFVQLAAEYHLRPVYMKEFHEVFEEHQDHPEFKSLMVRMRVVDDNGESAMDEDQWEAANIYIAFAFEKQ